MILMSAHPAQPSNAAIKMTDRQREVAELAAKGLGYTAIGQSLGISPHTARAHINTIATRLPGDGRNPLRLVALWMRGSERRAS